MRIEGVETTVRHQGEAFRTLESQVKDLAARLSKVEEQPAAAGPNRKHTLVFGGWRQDTKRDVVLQQLSQALAALSLKGLLDTEPFCTGARRSVALCQFRKRPEEADD